MCLVDGKVIHVYLCDIRLVVLVWFYLLDLKRNNTKGTVEVMLYTRCNLLHFFTVSSQQYFRLWNNIPWNMLCYNPAYLYACLSVESELWLYLSVQSCI